MASFKFAKANGKAVCRGDEPTCIGIPDRNRYRRRIPKGSNSLGISIYGAGGSGTAYYCEVCLIPVLEAMNKILQEANNQDIVAK